ncbi:TPA: hypothetical protein DCY65_01760 [Candidatus Acetothermia bacterium]|nr:hypothetical protein [Candidatus Acetothermia bacterium]
MRTGSRKRMLLCGLAVVGVCLLALVAVYLAFLRPVPDVSRTEVFFGMEVTMRARGRRAEAAIESAFRAVEHILHTMSRFREGSDVWRINTSAPGQMVGVSQMTFDLIRRALLISEMTGGAFDITILPLMELWRSARRTGVLPSSDAIEAARARVNWRGILLDADRREVGLQAPGMGIDLGGIAMGYAVDAAIATLKEHGIGEALVDASGDMYLLGAPPGREWWRIGIEDPRREGAIFAYLDLRNEAVATSGDYRWYFMVGERRFHHIIAPRTGFPVERMQSVTIVAPDATLADGLSTGIFVLGAAEGIRLVEGLDGVDAVIVSEDADGNRLIAVSSGIEGRTTLREDARALIPAAEEPVADPWAGEPAHQEHLAALLANTGLTFTAATKDDLNYYRLYDSAGRLQGFVLPSTEQGWGGPIELFVQTDPAGVIARVFVWRHQETPIYVVGLEDFLRSFRVRPAQAQLVWQRDVHGLTGATVTAEAIIAAVRRAGTLAQEKGVFIPPEGGPEP